MPISVNEESSAIPNVREFKEDIKKFEADDLSYVSNRLISQHLWLESGAEHARLDFIRFVALTKISDQALVPTNEVDEFWHSFILFTREYFAWCEDHWGPGFYLHHTPGHRSDGSWERTQALMKNVYGIEWENEVEARSCYTPPPQDPPSCWVQK